MLIEGLYQRETLRQNRDGVYKTGFLFIITLAFTCFSSAAQVATDPVNINFVEFLSQRNGMSSNLVTDMVQDKQGYLWIGTQDGLNRYDGYTFKIFRKKAGDSTSIQFNRIYKLAVDREGNIWAGSTDGLISYFHPPTQKFRNFDWLTSGLPGDGIAKIFFDRHDNVWVTVNKHGLYKLDKAQQRFHHVADLPGIHPVFKSGEHYAPAYNTIYDIHEDQYGMLWMATHDGLYFYNPRIGKFTVVRDKPIVPFLWRNDCFVRILPTEDGFWLSAYGGGLSHFNIKTKRWKTFKYDALNPESPTHNIVYEIGRKSNDELWVCSVDRGWGIFDIKKSKFFFPETSYLANYNIAISDMVIQPSGVAWFSSHLKGIFKYAPDKNSSVFHKVKVNHSDNGESYRIVGFYRDQATQKLYYGTQFADGVHIRNLKTNEEKILPFETKEPYLEVNEIKNDALDTLWVVTRDYLYFLDKKNETLKKYHHQPPITKSPMLRDVMRSRSGELWISSYTFGIFKLDPATGIFENFQHDPSDSLTVSSNFVRELVEDNQGNIWVATNNGLSVFDRKKNSFRNYVKNESDPGGLGSNNIIGIVKLADGSIWVATADNGLYKCENTSDSLLFSPLGTEQGMPSDVIVSLTADPYGTLWVGTPSALVSVTTNKEIKSYFQSSVVTEITYDSVGSIFMAGTGGYLHFNPKVVEDQEKTATPNLVINSFRYFDTEVPLWFDSLHSTHITLQHDQNFISLDFAALDFTDPSKNVYSYFLEGADKDWINAGDRHYVSYTNLSPSTYIFRVKAANPEGIWTEPGLTIYITITPPFWSTWYFRLLAVSVFFIVVYFLYNMRINKIRKAENLKSEYNKKIAEIEMTALRAQMNPHFIFNSLNSINRYILKADPETASLYLTKFSRLIRMILDNSKNSRILLETEIAALCLYIEMELIRFDHRFSYHIECKPSVNPHNIEIPPMIYQPYVENAIWHGLLAKEDHGKLDVILDIRDNMLICIIEDNGIGREKSQRSRSATGRKKSYGMQITSSRLDLLRTESKMESSVEVIDLKDERGEGAGTRVIVKMPVVAHNESAKMIHEIN